MPLRALIHCTRARPFRLAPAGPLRLAAGERGRYNPRFMDRPVSIAIETSCRRGGVALGAADQLVEAMGFQAERRQSVQLIARLDELLGHHGLGARDLAEVYVSLGPGSFTGLRVGITVARTLGQTVEALRCVGVPTAEAVAENAAGLDLQRLGVVMAAKEKTVSVVIFSRQAGRLVPAGPPRLADARHLTAELPKPITLIGEALWYQDLSGQGITIGDEGLWLPRAEGLWRVGRRMARTGEFQEFHALRPLYLREPEAVRLWERREGRA